MSFAYERQAKAGEPMPEGLSATEQWCYQSIALLAAKYRFGAISGVDAAKEMKLIEQAYLNIAAQEKYIKHVAHLWLEAECAAMAFGNNPSLENGHKMYEAIYGCVLKKREADSNGQ